MTNHRTKRETAENRAGFIAQKATVIRRYTLDGVSLAALCRDYGVSIEWLRWQFDVWEVPRRARGRAAPGAQPAHEAERAVLAQRLADPRLLGQSIVVNLSAAHARPPSATRLAVPVGGARVAGEITVANWGEALITILQLDEHARQFPNVRQRKPLSSPWEPRTVCWGVPTPAGDMGIRGQMFGYHSTGVRSYIAEHAPASAIALPR
ncbi:hypothetical protein FNV62_54825 [Streptomyces sp. RLB3-17]|uniref:DUF6302 family protein n=1 Tax=Streptomyces sp. RLB3-17 TaxID=2594455 RepID=UPI001163C9CF|nr:DUF6302 family protein [Streptomyces sp. RLB3-17]QDO45813.1 hypothetical protein FNV62_54825 [Streptomyces sp. RLB3-17]